MTTSLRHLVHRSRHLSQQIHPSLLQKSCCSTKTQRASCPKISKRPNSSSSITPTTKQSDYFPWQHTSSLPDRVVNDSDDLSGMPNNMRARFVRRMIAGRELNLTFWDILPLGFEREWEEELAGNFSTAYGMALSELLKSVFQVPVKNDFVTVSMDSSVKCKDEIAAAAEDEANQQQPEEEVKNEESQIVQTSKDDNDEVNTITKTEKVALLENEYLNSMVDKNLLARYQLVDKESIHVKLSVEPTSAKLQHIFAIPLLTREIVEQKPHLKGGYLRIEKAFEETKSYDTVREMTFALAEDVGRENFQRTVVAEAAIQCKEFFQVKDAVSGEILRGMEDEEEAEDVVHLVRFEVVTDKREDGQGREVGNWKIIDWDDLLNGNTFH